MIALRQGVPLVTLPNGQGVFFNKQWIINALQQAAELAGYSRWSAAFPLADAMTVYLQRECENNTITLSDLEHAIKKLLFSLKHDDIAHQFLLPDPPKHLSLVELVYEAGTGYELAFFQLLRKQLQTIAQSKTHRLEINDLDPCLQLLTSRHRMSRKEILREEIVNYIRSYSRSHLFRNSRQSTQPLEIELS